MPPMNRVGLAVIGLALSLGSGHRNNGLNQNIVLRVTGKLADQGVIDLDGVERDRLERGPRKTSDSDPSSLININLAWLLAYSVKLLQFKLQRFLKLRQTAIFLFREKGTTPPSAASVRNLMSLANMLEFETARRPPMPIRCARELRSRKLIAIALVVMSLHASGTRADDPNTPMFSFNGFGTLGLVHSSEDKADFTSSIFKPNGAGHSHSWHAGVDSIVGAQLTADLTPRLSAVLQVISEQRYDNSYVPTVEWANIKYQFTPDFSVRIGRSVLPAFLLTDYRKVGYATPWVRPPIEVYQLLPVTNSDGVDASYRLHLGEFTNTVRGNVGKNDTKLTNNGGYSKARHSWGISNTTEYGPLTVHVTYLKTNLTVESINPLFNSFRLFGPEGIAIADKYDSANKPFPFLGLGASYDPGKWFVMGEWGHANLHSVLGEKTAWYASGGYRLGKFTPYLIYAQAKVDSNTSDPGLTVSTLPPFLAGPATGLNAALNGLLGSATVQNTISFGGRWDFAKNAALKLQFDQTRLGAGSPGVLSNTQPGFQPGGKLNLFSVTIDFVF